MIPMAMRVDFHPRAIAEARGARLYYIRANTALALRFVAELDDTVTYIGSVMSARTLQKFASKPE